MKIAKKNTNKDFKNLAVQTTCKHNVEQLYISAKNIWVFFSRGTKRKCDEMK